MAEHVPKAVAGSWAPTTSICYGVATSTFLPLASPHDASGSTLAKSTTSQEAYGELNSHQVSLEVGDEVYVFEVFRPAPPAPRSSSAPTAWYRGYVVSSSSLPKLSSSLLQPSGGDGMLPSTTTGTAILNEEPQVSVGIFPASHVQIRDHLEDLSTLSSSIAATAASPPPKRDHIGALAPLQEEEEETEEDVTGDLTRPISLSGPGGTPTRRLKNRLSGSSLTGFSAPVSPAPRHTSDKPAPPLPNLKCGDETLSGTSEPLVDEIACALREWATHLYSALYKRDYTLFHNLVALIDAISAGRKQLLTKNLGREEEKALRRRMVVRLGEGNALLGLEVLVRHQEWGGLVEVDVEQEKGAEVRKGWCSAVRMYAMQVALAYSLSNTAINLPSSSTIDQDSTSASNARLSIPNSLPHRRPSTFSLPFPVKPSGTDAASPPVSHKAAFHHVFISLRAFVANPCLPGETAELYFSLFSKPDARYLTEEFCVILNHQGAPERDGEGRWDKMSGLFIELGANDLQEEVYLVCRIVKNGTMKLGDKSGGSTASATNGNGLFLQSGGPRERQASYTSDAGSLLSDTVSQTGVELGLGTTSNMLIHDPRSGRQSVRRPFGCAVLEISQFARGSPNVELEYQMPIFVPATEGAFASLHEDIIASRIKEIEKSPRADHLAVNVRVLYGVVDELIQEQPGVLAETALVQRLGFPDVTFPGDERNEVYLKVWSGEFESAGGKALQLGGGRNWEVGVEVRTADGAVVERCLGRGAGEGNVTHFNGLVYRGNNSPVWAELVKLDIPIEIMEQCHLFFTFRSRSSTSSTISATSTSSTADQPTSFAYLPLFLSASSAFISDGSHSLILYRYDRHASKPAFYFQAPPLQPPGAIGPPAMPPSITKTLVPLRDSVIVRSFLVSTKFTQNETLLGLLKWEQKLAAGELKEVQEILTQLRFCGEVEVCKFLRDIFDALFGILSSTQNQSGQLDDLVFQALVTILAIVSDRRFTNFKPVLDVYVEQHFTASTASARIVSSLERLLRTHSSSPESGTVLRSSIKVWHYLFKFIVRSRELQRAKDAGSGVTSDHLENSFKQELSNLLLHINTLMRATSPSSIIGTQTLAVQHFASIVPDLATCFAEQELADIVVAFGDSIVAQKGKISVWKLLFYNQVVHSVAFEPPNGRAALVPNVVRWIKMNVGKFDEVMMVSSTDSQPTKDNARVSWLEGIRLAVGAVAAMLDSIQEALVTPKVRDSRSLLGQEQDNVEYVLGLLPRLLESYREFESSLNLESVERQRSQVSVVSVAPVIFPSSYPFSLLAKPPPQLRLKDTGRGTLQAGMGEIACIFVALLLLAPRKIFVNWLEGTLEIEGRDNFARLLTQIFRVSKSILENDAYPAEWLNINILAHRMVVRMIDPVADVLEREFIPTQQQSFTFNTSLWRDFFAMLLRLLASPQLLIEEFSPQKRRAVWRLAGDIRGDGAKILSRLWSAIGWPDDSHDELSAMKGRHGGYQVQFVPSLVEDVLSLCLSHHDELRTSAVHVLFSMIVSEYYLNDDFSVIQAEVIDRLDKLFMSQTKGDEISRAFFVGQLRTLFDEATIDDRLREQVNAFLASVNSFLDLLLAVRNLPEGEEYQEDRIISTLKLMSFIRGIGRSEIFIRYVQRLVAYHVALGNETEAGLTLKLHADLHDWDLHHFVGPIEDLGLPRQTEFARKETLYMRMLSHLSKGKAWETALEVCKELQHQYETISFDYARLSELLILQAELYGSIAKSERHFGEYFRVAFYGNRFPVSVGGKQFIYRGDEWETLGAFVEKMLNKHPSAQLLKTSTIPSEELQLAEGQFLQITAVTPEPDMEAALFRNPDVPQAVRAYHQHNGTNTFSFSRPVSKDPGGRTRVAHDYISLWTEKTVLICEDAFPTVLRRSEVVEIRIIDISPLENALRDVESKAEELAVLERRYHDLSQTESDRSLINTNSLSMALNGVVDAPVNQGVPMYRQAFFGADFMAANPDKAAMVQKLQDAIDKLVQTISRCMKLHAVLAPEAMQPFHETLEKFLEKNFAGELARLPHDPYEAPLAPYAATGSESDGSRTSVNPLVRHSGIDLNYLRRDSTSSARPASTVTSHSGEERKLGVTPSTNRLGTAPNATLSRAPSLYAGGRSLDAVAEVNGSPAPAKSIRNGSINGAASVRSTKTGSIFSERASITPEKRGSILGSLGRFKPRKASAVSISEE